MTLRIQKLSRLALAIVFLSAVPTVLACGLTPAQDETIAIDVADMTCSALALIPNEPGWLATTCTIVTGTGGIVTKTVRVRAAAADAFAKRYVK